MKIFKKKLEANSLFLAIIISFIASILLFLFILSRYFGFIEITNSKIYQQLSDNVGSALNVIIQNSEIVGFGQDSQVNLYSDSSGIVNIGKRQWGVYGIAYARADWKNHSVQKIALFGLKTGGENATGLYLADHGHYLAVAGDTYISGINFLPKLGVRKAYIDGHSFKYKKTVNGVIKESKTKLPALPDYLISYIKNNLFGSGNVTDSIVMEKSLKESEIYNSYLNKTLRIYNTEGIKLTGIKIKGNCIVHSESFIQITKSAVLENIICVAPLIYVDPGFEGEIQLFATDTIEIGGNAILKYPSSLVVAGIERTSAFIHLAENAQINGTIIAFAEMQQNNSVSISIDNESEIFGTVYCDGKIQHKGKIFGSVYCNLFFLQTRQGYYENHILNGWIDPGKLEPAFISGNVIPSIDNTQLNAIVQWLE